MSQSDALIAQYKQLHAQKTYGTTSELQVGYIRRALDDHPGVRSILDYGCGQSRCVDWLATLCDAKAYRYDPAIPDYATCPVDQADLVLSTDVLEHVPEADVPGLLGRMRAISPHCFLNIALTEAIEILPNGENAHCTVKPIEWWAAQLRAHYPKLRRVRSYSAGSISLVTW